MSSIALEWNLAWFQQLSGDIAAAHVMWQRVLVDAEAARRIIEHENWTTLELASAYVALGDEAKAFSTLENDAALPSSAKDAMAKTFFPLTIAQIAVQAGKKDLALEQLAISARNPVGVEFGDLKFNPLWDSLRGDPRFESRFARAEGRSLQVAPFDTFFCCGIGLRNFAAWIKGDERTLPSIRGAAMNPCGKEAWSPRAIRYARADCP